MQIETERKFLICYPDIKILAETFLADKKEMVQTYLNAEKGVTSRVRKVTTDKGIKYIRTEKRRISLMSAFEDESEISVSGLFVAIGTAGGTDLAKKMGIALE